MITEQMTRFVERIYRNPEIANRVKGFAPKGEDREDFFQTVHLKFWSRVASAPEKLFAVNEQDADFLLRRIARDWRTDIIRRHKVRKRACESAGDRCESFMVSDAVDDPAESAWASERHSLLLARIMELPEHLGWAVREHVILGRSLSDMAKGRGVSGSTVKSWLQGALRHLRLTSGSVAA